MIFVRVNLLFTDSNSLLQPEKEQQQQQQKKQKQKGHLCRATSVAASLQNIVLTGTTQTAVNMITV